MNIEIEPVIYSPPKSVDVLTFTEVAADEVKSLLVDQKDAIGLRVFVQGGGCSGMIYGFSFADEIGIMDTVIEVNETKLLVDHISISYLEGATIDFKSDLMGSQFTINNPRFSNTCGCGSSFSID